MSLSASVLLQVPTVDDVEDFFGADQWSLSDFVWAAIVIVVAVVVSRLVIVLVRRVLRRFTQFTEESSKAIARGVGWMVVLIGIVYALSIIGIDLVPAVMVILVLAVIMFFAGRGIMANFSAGLVLRGSPMFTIGDELVTPAGTGRVQTVGERTVVIETVDGKIIEIPNHIMIEYPITNLTKMGARLSTVDVGVAYGTDLRVAKTLLVQAADDCAVVHADPLPEVVITEFGDHAINLQVRFWHAPAIIEELRSIDAVAESIDLTLAEHGIVVAFPQRTLWWGTDPTDEPTQTQKPTAHFAGNGRPSGRPVPTSPEAPDRY
jgi:small-conductance mechanosensitive channel